MYGLLSAPSMQMQYPNSPSLRGRGREKFTMSIQPAMANEDDVNLAVGQAVGCGLQEQV